MPTWLYESVQLSGPVRVQTTSELRPHLNSLSEKFEGWLTPKPSWVPDKVTSGRREMLMKAIVGIEMMVETVEGSFKLNQHKADVDHVAVATALARQADAGSQTMAARMVALRMHLDYEPNAALCD